MEFLKSLIEEIGLFEAVNLERDKQRAQQIIQSFATPQTSYHDFLMRIIGLTNKNIRLDPRKSQIINVIPVLDALVAARLATKKPNGSYVRSEALSRMASDLDNRVVDDGQDGVIQKTGKLSHTKTGQMTHMLGDQPVGDKLDNAQLNYKAGGNNSGFNKEVIIKTVKESDPTWVKLDPDTKQMVDKLGLMSDPKNAFVILKALLRLQKKKKGYTSFADHVEMTYTDQKYRDAILDLDQAGLYDTSSGMLNNSAIRDARNALEFFKDYEGANLKKDDVLTAFFPKLMSAAISTSGGEHRALNGIIKEPKYKGALNKINKGLTDEELQAMMANTSSDPNQAPIRNIAKWLRATSADELRTKLAEKMANRQDYKGDANKAAKDEGRVAKFFDLFDL